ncbi:MAG TPA: hypothetical protein VEL76_18395 [Gemmataceae bacterium]|nr:hypothetical protein [Gemmataceae bacterium]
MLVQLVAGRLALWSHKLLGRELLRMAFPPLGVRPRTVALPEGPALLRYPRLPGVRYWRR